MAGTVTLLEREIEFVHDDPEHRARPDVPNARADGIAPRRRWSIALAAACALATFVASVASADTFSARETHRGLVIDGTGTAPAILMPKGSLFRGSGDP